MHGDIDTGERSSRNSTARIEGLIVPKRKKLNGSNQLLRRLNFSPSLLDRTRRGGWRRRPEDLQKRLVIVTTNQTARGGKEQEAHSPKDRHTPEDEEEQGLLSLELSCNARAYQLVSRDVSGGRPRCAPSAGAELPTKLVKVIVVMALFLHLYRVLGVSSTLVNE
ncbi:hypothetical protein MKZ38_010740 [Zalerion maritima]|uniref:Uncharacterized protein n=1 Tax=Zalerion maritima TaxID=339359 RepID=A0AAD5WXQ5_9PEZI|nr:hypothetical protein MKZ38_010740 [Zalerion maritima]